MGKVWITNDYLEPIYNVRLDWRLIRKAGGEVIQQAQRQIALPADASKVTDHIVWPIPTDAQGEYRVEMQLTGTDGAMLSNNDFEFVVE